LHETGQPLDADALIDRVLETWHARPASVHTAIASDARFCRRDDGTLALANFSPGERRTERPQGENQAPPPAGANNFPIGGD